MSDKVFHISLLIAKNIVKGALVETGTQLHRHLYLLKMGVDNSHMQVHVSLVRIVLGDNC